MDRKSICRLVTFSRCERAYFDDGSTMTGYGSPDTPAVCGLADVIVPDGTLALDFRDALETDAGRAHVVTGPMVGANLHGNDVARCPDPSPLMAAELARNTPAAGAVLALQVTADDVGPLDRVSPERFVRGWVALGARAGVFSDGAIEWSR